MFSSGGCSGTSPFALQVLGNSMEPEFCHGQVIVVDPGHPLVDKAFVVAVHGEELIFGQYIEANDHKFIQYLNPHFEAVELLQRFEVKGVVVQRAGKSRKERKHYQYA